MSCAPTNLTFNTWDINGSNLVSIHPLHYKLRGSIGKIKFFFRLACVYSFLVEFWWNFLCWCKTVNILQKNIFRQILYKNMSFFKENVKGSNVKPEILHEDKMDESEKNVSKWFFWYSTPSWWKCNLKLTNIFSSQNAPSQIFEMWFRYSMFNSSPNVL